MNDIYKGDIISAGVLLGWMNSWLPAIATLLTVIWFAIRIWETDTVQKLVHRRKPKSKRRDPDEDMPTEME